MNILRRILFAPKYLSLIDRAHRASYEENWEEVVATVEKIHQRGVRTSSSRHYLGLGLLGLHRWTEALEQYEAIQKPIRDKASNSWRVLNHAIALYEVGRREDCAALLQSSIDDTWEGEPLKRAKGLLGEFQKDQ